MDTLDKRTISSPINGKKGGVKSDEGKAQSSQNSLKHGILANYCTSFDDTSFAEVYELFAEEYDDSTPTRKVLITQLAIIQIRLKRCARFEAEFLRHKLNPPKFEEKLV